MKTTNNDAIAAIATTLGAAAISIIRVSGKDAIKKVAKELGVNKNEVYKQCIEI